MDDLRQTGLLKNLGAMDAYCWQHGGSITEDRRSYGYIAETENYRFCLRCTPFPGEYQGYLYMDMTAQEYAELLYPTLLSARDERHVQTVLEYRNEVREWSIERLMEAEKNFFTKCGRLPEPYEYTAENGLPMYSVFCRLAKEAFEEIIRAQFLETQELSGPVLTM